MQTPVVLQEKLVRLPSSAALAEALRHPAAFLSGDAANIRRLAKHIDCSLEDATAVYRLARRDGYPSAYRSVFGTTGASRGGNRRLGKLPKSISERVAPRGARAGTATGRPR
jgi:hypothetical protein